MIFVFERKDGVKFKFQATIGKDKQLRHKSHPDTLVTYNGTPMKIGKHPNGFVAPIVQPPKKKGANSMKT